MQNSIQQLSDEIYSANSSSQIGIVQYGQPELASQTEPSYYLTLPLTTNPTIVLQDDPGGYDLHSDVLPNSINSMINDGLFSAGGEFENLNAIFIFTDAYVDFACLSSLANCAGCTIPELSCGYDFLTDLSDSFGGIPISVFRVLAYPSIPTAEGIQQNGGVLIEQNDFVISNQQIASITDSLGCLDSSIDYTNVCLGDITNFNINGNEDIISLVWGFGDGTTSTLDNPTHTYASAGNYTVTVTVTTITDVTTITEEITIYDFPIANSVSNYIVCDDASNDGFEIFDLSVKDSEILGTQSPTDFNVSYFLNNSDALNNTNPLPTNYTNIINNQEIFVSIEPNNSGCYAVTSFLLIIDEQPVANSVSDYIVCDYPVNDGFETFDLSIKDAEILGTQLLTNPGVAYFLSNSDAINHVNLLPDNYTNTTNNQEIFIKIFNIDNPDCYDITSFFLVINNPPTAHSISDYIICENESNVVDLSLFDDTILNGQSNSIYSVTYYETLEDAELGVNVIGDIYDVNADNQEIFIRVNNISDSECFDTTSFNIITYQFPFSDFEILQICYAKNYEIDATISDSNATYLWDDGSTEAVYTVQDFGIYNVSITIGTCTKSKQFELIEENCFIPEGISPNGDGLNEVFDISFLNAKNIVIYNRYGTEIFQYNNYKNEWDGTSKNGKLLPTGTYFYVITKPNDEMITGWVYLNR
jgi:gliding motility-associated-like protein